jgi:DNA-binding GntR family transcriptional regulator
MIQALRDGDRNALMTICRDHLLPSRDAYLASEQMRLRA